MKRYFSVFGRSSNKDGNLEKNPRMEELDSETTNMEPAPSDEADSVSAKKYRFNPQWLKTFDWLVYDQSKKSMFCKYCLEAGERTSGKTPYITGNTIFKRDNVTKHNVSKQHIACREAFLAKTQVNRAGSITAAVSKQNQIMNIIRGIKIKN